MSDETAIEAFLDAIDRRDGDSLADYLDEDVTYDDGFGSRTIGASAVRAALIRRAGALDERHGDRVVMFGERRIAVEVTLRGRYQTRLSSLPRPAGQSYSIPACLVFEMQAQRVIRLTRYLDSRAFAETLAGQAAS